MGSLKNKIIQKQARAKALNRKQDSKYDEYNGCCDIESHKGEPCDGSC